MTDFICRQGAEELYRLVKVVDYFLLRVVVVVAVGFQGTDASTVLVPLMFPEIVVIATEVFPVKTHVIKEISPT